MVHNLLSMSSNVEDNLAMDSNIIKADRIFSNFQNPFFLFSFILIPRFVLYSFFRTLVSLPLGYIEMYILGIYLAICVAAAEMSK